MSKIISLLCPTCGGKLMVTNDIEKFVCNYCGNALIIPRSGNIAALAPVIERLGGIKTGVDRTASELAISRLTSEIKEATNERNEYVKLIDSNHGRVYIGFAVLGLIEMVVTRNFSSGIWFIGILLLIFGSLSYINEKQKFKKASKLIDEVDKELFEKTQELNKHKAIVKVN